MFEGWDSLHRCHRRHLHCATLGPDGDRSSASTRMSRSRSRSSPWLLSPPLPPHLQWPEIASRKILSRCGGMGAILVTTRKFSTWCAGFWCSNFPDSSGWGLVVVWRACMCLKRKYAHLTFSKGAARCSLRAHNLHFY